MRLTFSDKINQTKTLIILTAVSLLLGLGASFLNQLGIILLPALAATVSLLLVFGKGRRMLWGVCASLAIILVDLILNGVYSFSCLAAVVVAIIITLWIEKGWQKSELAAVLTVFVSLVFVAYAFLSAFYELESFNLGAARELLSELFDRVRADLYSIFASYTKVSVDGTTTQLFPDELINSLLDQYMSAIISVVVVIAFATVGITLKIFTFIASGISVDNGFLLLWRFRTSAVFAIFYFVLAILAIFVSGSSVAALVILNLYIVFTAVYAYIGFVICRLLLNVKFRGSPFVPILMIVALLVLGSYAMIMLAVFGAFSMLPRRVRSSSGGDNGFGNDDNNDGQGG